MILEETGLFKRIDDKEYDTNKLFIPKEMKGIAPGAYFGEYGFDPLTIEVEEGNTCFMVINNCLIEKATGKLVFGCRNGKIPDDGCVKIIGSGAFYGRPLTSPVIIPEGVMEIENLAFSSWNLEEHEGNNEFILPESLQSIGERAFATTNFEKLVLGRNVVSIGSGIVAGNRTLKQISVNKENPVLYSENQCLINKTEHLLLAATNNPMIPEGVEIIGKLSLSFLFETTKVTFPSTIQKIETVSYHLKKELQFPSFNGKSALWIGKKGSAVEELARLNKIDFQNLD